MAVDKKEYRKPTLERLVLIPRENVLAVCNTGTGSGSYPNINCNLGGGCYLLTVEGPAVPQP
jgi:hypothetical protein